MAPVPTPIHPLLTDAKDTWTKFETILDWFSKLVDTAYGYTDGIIKYRQDQANKKYKTENAEKEAMRIMKEQGNQGKKSVVEKVLGRRDLGGDDEDEGIFDWDGFVEFLEKFEEGN